MPNSTVHYASYMSAESNSIKAVSVYILNVTVWKHPGGHNDQCGLIEHPSLRTQLELATVPTGRSIPAPLLIEFRHSRRDCHGAGENGGRADVCCAHAPGGKTKKTAHVPTAECQSAQTVPTYFDEH